ncbi:MAG: hypothetical protein IPM14_06310 [bacterium]|nr:hypothetical protein [bacterium]
MKKLFIPFVKTVVFFSAYWLFAVAVISLAGCQENDIAGPVSSFDKEQKGTADTFFRGIIRLDGVLDDPYPIVNSFYRISGEIEFEMQSILTNSMPVLSKQIVNIHLVASADLQYVCTVCSPSPEDDLSGFLSEVSDDRVALAGSSVSLLEKTYTIQGRDDGMMLKLTFIISNSGVELCTMRLALPSASIGVTELDNY